MKKICLAVLTAIVLLLVACEPRQTEPVVKSFDRTQTPIAITVYFYRNTAQVTQAYRQFHNIPRHVEVPERHGFAAWPEWRNAEPKPEEFYCEIHTLEPRRVDDEATLTLGHELLHCVFGSYHISE